jgi:hypothetical protein
MGSSASTISKNVKIMISLNVSSQQTSAKYLKEYLVKNGYQHIWMCTDIYGGQNFRDEITKNIQTCDIFIMLINDAWGLSGECKDEYNYAKRLHLTSHERQITKATEERKPILLPILFSDIDMKKYSHVELLASSTNFLCYSKEKFEENDINFFENVKKSIDSLCKKEVNLQIQEDTKYFGISTDIAIGEYKITFSEELHIEEIKSQNEIKGKKRMKIISYQDYNSQEVSMNPSECSEIEIEVHGKLIENNVIVISDQKVIQKDKKVDYELDSFVFLISNNELFSTNIKKDEVICLKQLKQIS